LNEAKGESAKLSKGLLAAGDPFPAVVDNSGAHAPVLLVCDHAGRAVPQRLGDLGLPPAEFERHIAWDIGAGALSRRLGAMLGAPVVAQAYSRLVIDCNRGPARADSIVEVSDGTTVPANVGLSAEAREARIAEVHAPYHARIAAELDRPWARPPAVVLIHSFTPVMNAFKRPWQMGVLHLHNSPLSVAMLRLLQGEDGLVVGDNEPYAMDGVDYTAPTHAMGRGLDYLELEIRQDLIADAEGQERFAALIARLLPQALARAVA
jgi:predicted N-formylglutamate amidohydrolase